MPDFIPIPGKEQAGCTIALVIDSEKQGMSGSTLVVPTGQSRAFVPVSDDAAFMIIPFVSGFGGMEFQVEFKNNDSELVRPCSYIHSKRYDVKQLESVC
jgi:hypothetical protein